jgi:secondary thiamine-phosphate synthase enzyme
MKTYSERILINSEKRIDFINLDSKVNEILRKSGVKEGLMLINSMHITSSVFINDNESGLLKDFKVWLEKLAPVNFPYNHHQTGEDNGFAHLWRTLMGREVVVAITRGKMDFGPWESIFYGEFDGQRNKNVVVKIIGE